MGFAQFLAILRARWKVAAAVLAVTVLTTLLISLLLPKQYIGTASVVVDIKPDPVAGAVYPGMLVPSYIATQVDVLESDRVALRVAKNLKLAENPAWRQQWMDDTGGTGNIESWIASGLGKGLDVKPSKESNVINVTYKSPDPKFAAQMANAFVQAYLDTTVDLRVDPARQYSSFFEQRSKAARDALEKAQTRLSAFEREKGIIASDERLDVENARLNELSTQLVMAQAMSAESNSRQGHASDNSQEVLNNPLIAGIKADLSREEAKLQELSSRLGDNNPQVIQAKATVNSLRGRLDAETKRIMSGAGVTNSVNRQREGQIRAELEEQRAKVLKMKSVRDEGGVLLRDVENAQHAYDAVLQRLNQSSLESQTTQSNISVLSEASVPTEPASPKVVLNTLLSFVVGLMLAAGAAFGLELMDRRVRSVEDISASVGLPVLGVLPKPNATKKFGGKNVPLLQQRLLTSLPAPARGQ